MTYIEKNIKTKVLSSLFWKFMERGGTQGIQFIVQIVLARLLTPADYGIIALVVVFTSIASVFVQSGMNSALIQKKDADDTDFSSVFYLSLMIAVILYIVLFLTAPYLASFYKMPEITLVFRVLTITLIFGAVNSIQNAVISRNLQFKRLFFSSIGALLISGTIGIVLAYKGYGVWSLVWQQIVNNLMVTLILWFTVRWRPCLTFSVERIKDLFDYGWKLLVSSLIATIYNELRTLIIGKMFSPAMLGYYNRGQQFPSLAVSNIDSSIQSVMFPVLSAQQGDRVRVKNLMRRAIVSSSFIVCPMMAGLAVVAEPMVIILLTEKWLSVVPFLQIFCVIYVLFPIHTANLQAINALGRSDIFLRLEIIKTFIGLAILLFTIRYGVYAIALGGIVSGITSSIINAYPNKQLLNYSYAEQIKDIAPSLGLSSIMGIVVYCLRWLGLSALPTLLIQVIAGVIIYSTLSKLLKLESYIYLSRTISEFFKSKLKN